MHCLIVTTAKNNSIARKMLDTKICQLNVLLYILRTSYVPVLSSVDYGLYIWHWKIAFTFTVYFHRKNDWISFISFIHRRISVELAYFKFTCQLYGENISSENSCLYVYHYFYIFVSCSCKLLPYLKTFSYSAIVLNA